MRAEHKRVKIGAMPGEIPMGMKIDLREFRGPHMLVDGSMLGENACKSLRRYMKAKAKTVQRQRDRNVIASASSETPSKPRSDRMAVGE